MGLIATVRLCVGRQTGMTQEPENSGVLLIGLEQRAAEAVEQILEGIKITHIREAAEVTVESSKWNDSAFAAIFCGPTLKSISNIELGQMLQNQCPGVPKFFVTLDNTTFEVRNLIKSGFTDVFLLPVDNLVLRRAVAEHTARKAKNRIYRTVRIFDLEPGTRLEFDTYLFLPLNRKYVRFTSANQELDSVRHAKLTQHKVNSVFVDVQDMQKFYHYAAQKLRDPGQASLTATERQERLQAFVRTMFSDIFDPTLQGDEEGAKAMMDQCRRIISTYITEGASGAWYTRLCSALGATGDAYGHASNTSTFAALFAMGVGHPNPENLAMAGLFHDLGLTTLPEAILEKTPGQMTGEEKHLYFMHAERSLSLVKSKRFALTEEVEKSVLQHHETYIGDGYPNQLKGEDICQGAQIVSFADQFDELTCLQEGQPRRSPLQALVEIKKNGSIEPGLLDRLRQLLIQDNEIETEISAAESEAQGVVETAGDPQPAVGHAAALNMNTNTNTNTNSDASTITDAASNLSVLEESANAAADSANDVPPVGENLDPVKLSG